MLLKMTDYYKYVLQAEFRLHVLGFMLKSSALPDLILMLWFGHGLPVC